LQFLESWFLLASSRSRSPVDNTRSILAGTGYSA
jgi:hypothetical protein